MYVEVISHNILFYWERCITGYEKHDVNIFLCKGELTCLVSGTIKIPFLITSLLSCSAYSHEK
jgi:hypothetical protein